MRSETALTVHANHLMLSRLSVMIVLTRKLSPQAHVVWNANGKRCSL